MKKSYNPLKRFIKCTACLEFKNKKMTSFLKIFWKRSFSIAIENYSKLLTVKDVIFRKYLQL